MRKGKTCKVCNKYKYYKDYYKHPQMADGYLGKCKSCQLINTKEARERRPEYYRAYDRDRDSLPHRVKARAEYAETEQGKARIRAGAAAWNKRNPHRKKANTAVSNAIRAGRLVRQPCEVCGEIKVHGHHDDYSKPLEVRWLCVTHHVEHHNIEREESRKLQFSRDAALLKSQIREHNIEREKLRKNEK